MTTFAAPSEELLAKLKILRQLKTDIKEHEEFLEKNKKDFATLEAECVILMDNASMTQTKIDGVTMFRKTDKYASIDKDHEKDAWKWLQDHGMAFLIKETVNSRSLTSAIGELPEQEIATLPKSIKYSPIERIGMRGLKVK